MTGEEARDMMFGRIFGLRSIISSGILSRPSTTIEDFQQIFEDLHEISLTKSYLSEVCYHVLVSMLPMVSMHRQILVSELNDLVDDQNRF